MEIPAKAGYFWRRGYHPVSEISGVKKPGRICIFLNRLHEFLLSGVPLVSVGTYPDKPTRYLRLFLDRFCGVQREMSLGVPGNWHGCTIGSSLIAGVGELFVPAQDSSESFPTRYRCQDRPGFHLKSSEATIPYVRKLSESGKLLPVRILSRGIP